MEAFTLGTSGVGIPFADDFGTGLAKWEDSFEGTGFNYLPTASERIRAN
jgi:hypothetical protein